MPYPEPGRGRQLLWLGLLTLVACAICYLYLDRPVIRAVAALDPAVRRPFQLITQGGDSLYSLLPSGLLYVYCLWAQCRQPGEMRWELLERWKRRGQFMFIAVASSGLLVNLIKFVLGRARPFKLLHENLYGFHFFETSSKMTSFPSGHSNTAMAIALVLWYLWPKSWPLGFALALGVMSSRVMLTAHYPSDTLAGAYVAVVTTYYLALWFQRRYPGRLRGEPA